MCIVGRIPKRAVCCACGHVEGFERTTMPWLGEPLPPRRELAATACDFKEESERLKQMWKVAAFLDRNPVAGPILLTLMRRTLANHAELDKKGKPLSSELSPELWDLVPHEDNRTVLNYLRAHYIKSREQLDSRLKLTGESIARLRPLAETFCCEACGGNSLRFVRE